MKNRPARLLLVRQLLPPEAWATRLSSAEAEAHLLGEIERRCAAGEQSKAACLAVDPQGKYASIMRRLRVWRNGGVEALVDCRLPPKQVALPLDINALIDATAVALPKARSVEIAAHINLHHGLSVGESKVRDRLRAAGLARPVGPPKQKRRLKLVTAEAEVDSRARTVPCWAAGAALMTVLDAQVGGTWDLAEAITACANSLPDPIAPVEDDRADRDGRGRFLPAYNRARPRRFARVGTKFESVLFRWKHKNPLTLRCRGDVVKWTHLRVKALLLTPLVIETGRLSELQYGLDDRLGQMTGRVYRPSTLDKSLREWKLIGAADAMGAAFLAHLVRTAPEPLDAPTGVVVLYGDGTVNPWWTSGHARCAKVSRRGKVMPAVTTVTLNNGLGTPVRYAAVSGQIYLPDIIPRLLDEYEEAAGPSVLQRVVVLDRESHAVAFFKQLGARHTFIIALRSNVTGPTAPFRDVGAWTASSQGTEVCDGFLTLHDRRSGQRDLEVRVVGFRRRANGSVLWLATNGGHEVFTSSDIARIYLGRWPNQERQYRDTQGRIGFGRIHGYGKEEVEHVAVVTRLEVVKAMLGRLNPASVQLDAQLAKLAPVRAATGLASDAATQSETAALSVLEFAAPAELANAVSTWREMRVQAAVAKKLAETTANRFGKLHLKREALRARETRLTDEQDKLSECTTILTVDTELDEIMLGIKCMFIHLAQRLLREFLGLKMEIDSLIRRVLTLPGEMDVDRKKRPTAVRIYRNPKDPDVSAAIERAISSLNLGAAGPRLAMMDAPKGWIR